MGESQFGHKTGERLALALLSYSNNSYSETFIAAHQRLLAGEKKLYFGGFIPALLKAIGKSSPTSAQARCFFLPWQSPQPLKNLALHFLARSFQKEKINCALAEYGTTGAIVYPVCQKLSIPLIVHFHGFDVSRRSVLKAYKVRYSEMFKYASSIIVVSKAMKAATLRLGCPEEKIIWSVCGPDDLFFEIKSKNKWRAAVFFGAGRFVEKKAPHKTIFAFHQVLKLYPDARLIMAGDGPLLSVCKKTVKHLGISRSIEFPGVLTPFQIRDKMKMAMAFVQHSVTAEDGDMEGTPVSILEAQAAGLPVISTLHAGIPDVVIHGETGLLCGEHDVDAMAKNMVFVLDNPDRAEQMGLLGRKRVAEKFTLERHINTINQLVEKSCRCYDRQQ